MKKIFAVLTCLLAVSVGLRAEILEQVLVKVNGEILTKTDLEKLQIAALRDRSNGNVPRMSDAELAKALAEVTPTVIVDAVDELLLMQRAKTLGLTISDEQFNSVLESIKKDNKIESEEAFQQALKAEGMTLPLLRKMLERRMLIGQLQQREVISRIDITETEAKEYYEAHKSEFGTQPSVTLREILVSVPTTTRGVNAGAVDDAERKANDLRARVLKGESFEKVAAEASDAPSKANGGLIGPIPKSELDEELAKTLASMKVGDITPVIRVANGWEILKLEANVESTTLPFEMARQQITEKIGDQRREVALKQYIKKLRSQAIIEWKNDEIKKAWEAGLAAQEKNDPADAAEPPKQGN
jgi:peptidyl-prolyl cis-trans isomerase SurA